MGYYDADGAWIHEESDIANPGVGFSQLLNMGTKTVPAQVRSRVVAELQADPTIRQAATGAIEEAADELRLPVSTGAGDMILAGEDDQHTWIQARNDVDPATGVALPTPKALEALARVGVPAAAGDGDMVLAGENGVPTWLQASRLHRGGVAGPTPQAVAALALAGVPAIYLGPPPVDLNLAKGEARIYLNDGEPVLAVGS